MKIYVDTSVLVSLYIEDAHSPRADAWRQAHPAAITFTRLHRIEFRNALGLAVFQQRLTRAEAQAAWQDMEQDLASGLLVPAGEMWTQIADEAERLAELHTPTVGSRSLDILHVAAALALGATAFVTFDERQSRLARIAGLGIQS